MVIRGEWGRGKTTLLRRTKAILDTAPATSGKRAVRTVWFNAWKYPAEDSILAGLLAATIHRIEEQGPMDTFRLAFQKHKAWLLRTAVGEVAARVLQSDLTAPESRYAPIEEKRAFYDKFEEFFGELSCLWFGKPGPTLAGAQADCAIAIFLDDLDRCPRSRIVDVLEAIKLFLNMPGVCVFLGLSWQRLVDVLKSGDFGDPNEFLEKIVQVSIDLPEVSSEGSIDFVTRLLKRVGLGHLPAEETRAISEIFTRRSPRHLKRFVNDLSLRIALLRNTAYLGKGKQLSERDVLSWHVLLGSVGPERRQNISENRGNLTRFLQGLERMGRGEKPGEGEEAAELQNRAGLDHVTGHARRIRALSDQQLEILYTLASPAQAEPVAAPAAIKDGLFGFLKPDSGWWVRLPAGSFRMGTSRKDSDEYREGRVHLSSFEISQYEITNAQYAAFVEETGHPRPSHWEGGMVPPGKTDHPVVFVSWEDATTFCEWLGRKLQSTVRLPTEAQWEYAARGEGDNPREYPWGGDAPTPQRANFSNPGRGTTPVDTYPAGVTREGVWDLAGNVWEWCRDWYAKYDSGATPDPTGPKKASSRVLRGGSFYYDPDYLRGAYRGYLPPEFSYDFIGFRCVRESPGGQVE